MSNKISSVLTLLRSDTRTARLPASIRSLARSILQKSLVGTKLTLNWTQTVGCNYSCTGHYWYLDSKVSVVLVGAVVGFVLSMQGN